jgi:hypothetical protein
LTDLNVSNFVIENRMAWTRYKNYKSNFWREHAQFDWYTETNILPDYLQQINTQYKAKEIKKITQLTLIPQNIKYNIKDIHKVKTKYGNKLVMNITHKSLGFDLEYFTYLPDRFTS